jgi:hypothetical protein
MTDGKRKKQKNKKQKTKDAPCGRQNKNNLDNNSAPW